MKSPNFDEFVLEEIELLSIQVSSDEVKLVFNCPFVGWKWRSELRMLMKMFLPKISIPADREVELETIFTGVEWIGAEGQSLTNHVEVEKFFLEGAPVLENLYQSKIEHDLYQINFEFDCGKFNIIYRDFKQRKVAKTTG